MRAVVLAEGCLGEDMGKTANGLVLHAVRDEIVAVIDSSNAGRDAGEVVARRANGIPVVASFDAAYDEFAPEALYLGAATVGGVLPEWFRETVEAAIRRGMTVYNGLHAFLADDPRFRELAEQSGARIVDVRRPPDDLRVADGSVYDVAQPRVLVMGTDCAVGKRMTALELVREARARKVPTALVATGQTGLMLGCDAGSAIDRIPADFASGEVERLVVEAAQTDAALIVVYGQASIFHPAYAGVSLAILHGSAPAAVVLQVDPARTQRSHFASPHYTIADVHEEIETIERLGRTKVVAIAVNGKRLQDIRGTCRRIENETGLPAVDPLSDSAGALYDAVLQHLEQSGTFEPPAAPVPPRDA